MASINKVILVGRMGKDAELRAGKSGTSFTAFGVATDHGYGEKRKTEWHNVVVFGKSAEYITERGGKGATVLVEGRIESREYTDKAGVERKTTEILADNVSVLSGGKPKAETIEEPLGF